MGYEEEEEEKRLKSKSKAIPTQHIDVGVPLPNFCALERKIENKRERFSMLSFIRLISSRCKDANKHSQNEHRDEM